MLSEEALVVLGAIVGVALFVLGILEVVAPTRGRYRYPPRPAARDPWRRARVMAPAPRIADRQAGTAGTPALPGPPTPPPARRIAAPPRAGSPPPTGAEDTEPPIERLLRAQAAFLTEDLPPAEPAGGPPDATTMAPIEREGGEAQTAPLEREDGPRPARRRGRGERRGSDRHRQPPAAPAPVDAIGPAAAASPAAPPSPAGSVIDRCAAHWEQGRHAEVIADGMTALREGDTLPPADAAKLWGLVGLARQALGDHDEARAAFGEAVATAPPDDRSTWARHLAALALEVGGGLVARVESGSGADGEERVMLVRSAITWLEGGLACMPADTALREAAGAARRVLWPTYEEAVVGLIQRQDFHAARRLLREALADEECPAEIQPGFRDLLSATFGGEVGQLTAEAIRCMQEGREDEALATLERAEGVLATIPSDGLAHKRRQELERRLWWSYTKLGLRRIEAGMPEAALAPLLHALGFESVGPERRDETRAPLVRALETVVKTRGAQVRRLEAAGDHEAARSVAMSIRQLLDDALDRGLDREALAAALGRAQPLLVRLGRPVA